MKTKQLILNTVLAGLVMGAIAFALYPYADADLLALAQQSSFLDGHKRWLASMCAGLMFALATGFAFVAHEKKERWGIVMLHRAVRRANFPLCAGFIAALIAGGFLFQRVYVSFVGTAALLLACVTILFVATLMLLETRVSVLSWLVCLMVFLPLSPFLLFVTVLAVTPLFIALRRGERMASQRRVTRAWEAISAKPRILPFL